MVSFGNFARTASLGVGFHLGTLHGYFFQQDFWPNLNFLLEHQIKLVLMFVLIQVHTVETSQKSDLLWSPLQKSNLLWSSLPKLSIVSAGDVEAVQSVG